MNELVDALAGEGRDWLPHVGGPVHGGTAARLLSLLRDPGPATADPDQVEAGSLCGEQRRQRSAAVRVAGPGGIAVEDTLPWNANPWYVNRPPTPQSCGPASSRCGRLLLRSRHASVQAFIGTPAQDERWREEQALGFEEASRVLRGVSRPRR